MIVLGLSMLALANAPASPLVILSPRAGEVVFGTTVVEVDTGGAPVERLEFYVDGRTAGVLTGPPWRLPVEVGEENVEHLIEVVGRTRGGERLEAAVRTGRIAVHEEVLVTLQQVFVSAARQGAPVRDLAAHEFLLEEDGRPQTIVTFGSGDVPFTAVVLVDASLSMAGDKLAAARAGVRALAGGMRPLDEAKLIVFADRVRAATAFTTFPEVLLTALGGAVAEGGTALNDALRLTLAELEVPKGRRVVVLLSDGVDSHSVLRMRQVMPAVARAQAQLYWLDLGGGPGREGVSLRSPWRTVAEHAEEQRLLREAVAISGGRVVPAPTPAAISEGFTSLLRELKEQYVLGYYPPPRRGDGRWRRIAVRCTRPGVELRSAAGWVDR